MTTTRPQIAPRRAAGADVAAIAAVSRRAFAHYRPLLGREPVTVTVDFERLVAEDDVWVVEDDRGDVAGVLTLRHENDSLFIWSLAVEPASFGRGLGGQLLALAERRARRLGMKSLRAMTIEQLVSSRDWYVRNGFVETGVEVGSDRTIVYLRKALY